jgi:acyl-CoA thioesterase FadM
MLDGDNERPNPGKDNKKIRIRPRTRRRVLSYLDRCPSCLSTSVLLCGDEAGCDVFPEDHVMAHAESDEVLGLGDNSWVVRTNTCEIIDRAGFENLQSVQITSRLTRVGTTSWRAAFEISEAVGTTILARVWSLCVMVDRHKLRPTPLPHRDALVSVCFEEPSTAHLPTNDHISSEVPKQAFCWSTSARITDCDGLGHMNNTK